MMQPGSEHRLWCSDPGKNNNDIGENMTGKEAVGQVKSESVQKNKVKGFLRRRRWWLAGSLAVVAVLSMGTMAYVSMAPQTFDPPEAARILEAQKALSNFGILIPAYMPGGFDRENVEININPGSSNQPVVGLTYKNNRDHASVFLRQWVPSNPALETLDGSRPIQTVWGTGWLRTTPTFDMASVWVDIGQLRVNVSSPNLDVVSREQLVKIADTLGLASNLQVYSFNTEPVVIKGVEPPPPFEVPLNAQGVQEVNLTITPGGYSPMRLAVKKGIPVKIVFRAIGEVGCGNVLVFPANSAKTALTLKSRTDVQVLEYTPETAGEFLFECTNNHYRGILTVR
jgi:hypothetical protein